MIPSRDELQKTLQGVRSSVSQNFGGTRSNGISFKQPSNSGSVYKQVTSALPSSRPMPSAAQLDQVRQRATRAANMRKIDQFGVQGEFGNRVKDLAREIESGQRQFGGLRGEVNLDQAGIKLDPQVRELYTREDVPQSVKDAWTYLAIEQRAKELEGRMNDNGITGFFARLSGDVQHYDKLKSIMDEMSAGQNVSGGDVRNKDYAAQMKQAGMGATFPISIYQAATGDVAGLREGGKVGTQFMDSATFGLPSWFAGKEASTYTPETFGGKLAGGGLSAVGMLSSMQLLSPFTSGITSKVGQAATSRLGTSGLPGLLARATPGATSAAIVSGLRAPSSVNAETGQTDQSFGQFVNIPGRLENAAVGGGRYLASTWLGGALGEAANKAGASDIIRKVVQGIGGGSADVAFARARGVTDPGQLASEFGTGAAFGFLTGNQDYAETFGKEPGKATIKAVQDNLTKQAEPVKPQDLEQVVEQAGGWQTPGMKQEFDTALLMKDAAKVQELLPQVPEAYKQRFANDIAKLSSGEVLGTNTKAPVVDNTQLASPIKEELRYQLPPEYTAGRGQPTKTMGKNLYTLLNEKGYTRDKGAISVILSKLKGTWEGSPKEIEQARAWAGQAATSKQKRALYATLANKDFTIETYNAVASKALGIEPSKIVTGEQAVQAALPVESVKPVQEVQSAVAAKPIESIQESAIVPSGKTSLQSKWDDFATKVQNRAKPIEDLGQANLEAVRKAYGSAGIAKSKAVENLAPIFSDNGIAPGADYEGFLAYAVQRRNANVEAQGMKGASEILIEKSGILGKDKKISVPTEPIDDARYAKAFEQLTKTQHNMLDYAADNGIISRDLATTLKNSGDYVRFERVLEEGTGIQVATSKALGGLSQQTVVQKYKGSDKAIYDPIEATVNQMLKLENQVQRNNVATTAVKSLQQMPEYADLIKEVADTKGLRQDEYIKLFENGVSKTYAVPEAIGLAMKNLSDDQMNIATKIMAAPAGWLRRGATSYNLDFMVPNVLRDQWSAGMNSEYGYRPFVDYARGFKSKLVQDATYKEWLQSGGEIFGSTPKQIMEDVKPQGVESKFVSAVKTVTNPLKLIELIGAYSEEPTRIGLYLRAKDKGATPEAAMVESRRATSDFAVRGSQTKSVASVIPFLNARVQGFDSTVQAFKRDPKKAAINTAIYAVLPSLASAYAVSQTPVSDQISDYDKDKYFIFPIPGTAGDSPDHFIKVPKSETAMWLNPLRKATEMQAQGESVDPLNVVASTLGEMSPVGGFKSDVKTGEFRVDPTTFLPQAFKPVVETAANYDFYRDRQIVPDSMANLPQGYQAPSNIDPLFRQLGEAMPDTFNPAFAQQTAYSMGGGVAKQIADLVGRVTGAQDAYPTKDRPGASSFANMPVVSRVLGVDFNTPEEQSNSRYYAASNIKAKITAIANSRAIPQEYKDKQLEALYAELQKVYDSGDMVKPESFNPYGIR